MDPKLLDIISRSETPITNEQLANYLNDQLSPKDQHLLQKAQLEDGLEAEAIAGLEMIAADKLAGYQQEISKGLKEKLAPKKPVRTSLKKINFNGLLMLSGGLLALVLLAWFILFLLHHTAP